MTVSSFIAAVAPLLGLPRTYSATSENMALAVFTPDMETKNSSPVEGAPSRTAMAAIDGDSPGIQDITEPPRLPKNADRAKEPAGI